MLCAICLFAVLLAQGDESLQKQITMSEKAIILPEVKFDGSKDAKELEIGTVASGFRHVFQFDLINDTATELKIDDIKLSCGCLVALSDVKDIHPGQKAKIQFTLNVQKAELLLKSLAIVLKSENGENRLAVRIKGKSIYPFSLSHTKFELLPGEQYAIAIKNNFAQFQNARPKIGGDVFAVECSVDGTGSMQCVLRAREWKWEEGELTRQIPIIFCIGETVIQEQILLFTNPLGISVKPEHVRSNINKEGRSVYRLFIASSPQIQEKLRKSDGIEILLLRDDKIDSHLTVTMSIRGKAGERMTVVDVEVAGDAKGERTAVIRDRHSGEELARNVFVF